MDEVPLSVLPAVATELEEDDGARGEVRDGVSRGDLHTSPRRYLASGDRTGRNARPRCLQQCEDSVEAQGRGVRVGGRGDLLCRMQETALRHAEGCQRAWQLKALRQFKKASRPLVRAQRPCDAIHRSGRRLAVVVRCVRQHDRVHLCMGKIEASAQYVARLVVQSHGGRPERGSCKPRAV